MKESKVFWMEFSFQGQRIRESTHQPGITLARKVEDKRRQALRDGASGIRKAERPPLFSVAAREWMDSRARWAERTRGIAENSLKHLLPVFGKHLLTDIEAKDVTAYQRARQAEDASGRSINLEVAALRAVMQRAGQWARIQARVEMLPERSDCGRALSAEEEARLLAECGRSRSRALLPFVTLALECGARSGTLFRLQWRNVDFENRCLTFGRDKTRAGAGRTIPLTTRAVETLAFWAQSFPDRRLEHFVFGHERYAASGADEVFGFQTPNVYDCDPTRPTGSIKSAWGEARQRTRRHCPQCNSGRLADVAKPATGYECLTCHWRTAELPAGLIGVRIHDLRHSCASRLIAARVPLPIIGKLLGWAPGTLALMSARYGHFSVEEMRSALTSVERPKASSEEISAGSPQNPPKSGTAKEERVQ